MSKKCTQPLLSVIVPIYNVEKYLRRCLDSILNQTYKNLEIICVDDGSTDKSVAVLSTYEKRDNRIKAVYQTNQGESAARNVGLANATGEYIAFIDCDDWIEADMYETLIGLLEKTHADMAIGGWFRDTDTESVVIENNGCVKDSVFGRDQLLEYIYRRDEYQSFAYMWDKVYKKELIFDEKGIFVHFPEELQLGGDVLFLAKLALNTKKAVYTEKSFYHYYQRANSGCHSTDVNKRMDWIKAYKMILQIMADKHIDENIVVWVKRFMAYHCSLLAEIAYNQGEYTCMMECQKIMELYREEYVQTNQQYPERIERFDRIMNFMK